MITSWKRGDYMLEVVTIFGLQLLDKRIWQTWMRKRFIVQRTIAQDLPDNGGEGYRRV